jgi:hypothetical protein
VLPLRCVGLFDYVASNILNQSGYFTLHELEHAHQNWTTDPATQH